MSDEVPHTFTLFEYDGSSNPATSMYILYPDSVVRAGGDSYVATENELAAAQSLIFDPDGPSITGTDTTLGALGIDDFDKVLNEAIISRSGTANENAIRAQLQILADAARALTVLGVDVVI
ncbi:MAG: hypothetical protein ABJJ12_07190, partial [Marinomonas sp.]